MNIILIVVTYLLIGALIGGQFVGKNYEKIKEEDVEEVLFNLVTLWPVFIAMNISLMVVEFMGEKE